ncbi:UNVERIFIED_CONTAM: hypothetical protein Sradi_3024500 [Sesamum radiatum]|uniref:Uncharacterized protein n=1 Tax=Sesamum radiatum TaxID=300843 RepID=A0AAW2S2L7_SESRA
MELTRADLSDLQDLAESFSQLGIVELVNVQTNEITPALPPPEGNIIDFRNTERLIDEWVAALKIAATTLELDRENFIRLVELSLEGSRKIGWDNTPEDTKANILAGDSKSAIAERLGRLIKIHFIGDGYFEGSRTEKAREYTQALFGLELRNICAVDEYIYWFHKYFFQSGVATKVAAPMFFAKICSPWRKILIQSYKVLEGQLDSVAMRMSFLKDKLKDWCYQASIQKNMKRLRGTIKRTPLCCDNNDFPTIIGESNEPRKRKKQNNDSYLRSSKRTSFRRRSWWSKSKARTYKTGQRIGQIKVSSQGSRRTDTRSTGRTPTKRTFRWAHTRANESFKDCNCWTYGAKGYISPDCPQKCGELRKFEATNDILDAIYYGDLVPIYQFEDIPFDESVYREEIETYSDGSSIKSKTPISAHTMVLGLEESVSPQPDRIKLKETSHHLQGKLMIDIHPRIAYNLADQDFSKVLTLHQDFKRKDLMKEENRPYSIIYRIAYALFNTHHSDLFLKKECIEIPRIFKEFAKVMILDPIRIPRIGGVDIIIKDHLILERTLSNRTEQPVIGRYEGMLEIAGHEILVTGIAGKENGSMTLRLNFLEDHKPWGRKGSGICTAKPEVFHKEAMETLPVIAGNRDSLIAIASIRNQKKEIKNLKVALQERKSLDISEESKPSLENVKRLIQRIFSENPLAWWDRNKIEATLKVKEECKNEYVRYKPIQMNMEDKKDMQMIIKEHINLGLIEP